MILRTYSYVDDVTFPASLSDLIGSLMIHSFMMVNGDSGNKGNKFQDCNLASCSAGRSLDNKNPTCFFKSQ